MSVEIDGAVWVLVSDGVTTEILEEREPPDVVEILIPGVQGPPGTDGEDGLTPGVVVRFAYGDATPAPLATVPAGKHVFALRLFVEEPFDGLGATLAVGSPGSPHELLSPTDNDPAQAGTYVMHPDKHYSSETPILLTIVPGAGASVGFGQVQIDIEP
jgi:hypothetical protein